MYLRVLLITLIFPNLNQAVVKYRRNLKGPQSQHEIAHCIYQVSRDNFYPGILLGVTSSFNMTAPTDAIEKLVIQYLHASQRWLLQIVNDDDDKPTPREKMYNDIIPDDKDWSSKRKNVYYVIIFDNWERFQLQMPDLIAQQSFNPSAMFLIFIYDVATVAAAQRVLEFLWDNRCVNSVLMAPIRNTNVLNIYTLNVFNPAAKCFTNITCSVVATCTDAVIEPNLINLYRERVPANSHGCMIPGVAMVWPPFVIDVHNESNPGIEIYVVRTLAEYFNFKVNFSQSEANWGDRANGTWMGLFSKIQKDEATLAVGNIFGNQKIYEDFYSSVPYYETCVHWFVPIAELKPRWESLIAIFQWDMWLSLILTLFLMSIAWYYLAKYSRNKKDLSLRDFGICILNSLCVVVGITNPIRHYGFMIRAIFIFGSIYGLHVNALYQASLMKILTNPPHEHQISDIRGLITSNLKFGGIGVFQSFYNESNEVMFNYIFDNYRTSPNYTMRNYLRKVTDTRQFATMANHLATEYYIAVGDASVCNKQYCPAIYQFPAKVLCYPINMVAKKGFPYMIRINEILLRFRENGILHKWLNDKKVELKRWTVRRTSKSDAPRILTIKHLQGAFILYLFGIVVSFLLFIFEIVNHYNNDRKQSFKKKVYKRKKRPNVIKKLI